MKVKLKDNVSVVQPIANKPWKFGDLAGFVSGADNRPYAVVATENDEFEMLPIHSIQPMPENS